MPTTEVDQYVIEDLLTENYNHKVNEALAENDIKTILFLKWGRLFLTQTYGYWAE